MANSQASTLGTVLPLPSPAAPGTGSLKAPPSGILSKDNQEHTGKVLGTGAVQTEQAWTALLQTDA